MFLPFFLNGSLCSGVPLSQNGQCSLVVGKETAEQSDGNGKGHKLFRGHRKPEESEVGPGQSRHPIYPVVAAYAK